MEDAWVSPVRQVIVELIVSSNKRYNGLWAVVCVLTVCLPMFWNRTILYIIFSGPVVLESNFAI